jgi:hypothetical protein
MVSTPIAFIDMSLPLIDNTTTDNKYPLPLLLQPASMCCATKLNQTGLLSPTDSEEDAMCED